MTITLTSKIAVDIQIQIYIQYVVLAKIYSFVFGSSDLFDRSVLE